MTIRILPPPFMSKDYGCYSTIDTQYSTNFFNWKNMLVIIYIYYNNSQKKGKAELLMKIYQYTKDKNNSENFSYIDGYYYSEYTHWDLLKKILENIFTQENDRYLK